MSKVYGVVNENMRQLVHRIANSIQEAKEIADELIKLSEPTVRNTEKSLDSLCALCEFNREDLEKNLVALKQAGVSKLESR
jgi:hypothetical protein